MPKVDWKWEIGPQTIISGLNLIVMLGGILTFVVGIEGDVHLAQSQITDLRAAVTTLVTAQQQQAIDNASTKAKVDLMLPMVEKMNDIIGKK